MDFRAEICTVAPVAPCGQNRPSGVLCQSGAVQPYFVRGVHAHSSEQRRRLYAPGLRALYDALRAEGHEVRAVAPSREQSGVGSSVTSRRPLFAASVREPSFEGYAVDGTPPIA